MRTIVKYIKIICNVLFRMSSLCPEHHVTMGNFRDLWWQIWGNTERMRLAPLGQSRKVPALFSYSGEVIVAAACVCGITRRGIHPGGAVA